MLARIQTLYLLLASILAIGSMFLPFWSFSSETVVYVTDFSGFTEAGTLFMTGSFAGGVLSPLTAIAAFAAIFLFRKRAVQKKVIMLATLFFVGDLASGLTAAHFMNLYFEASGTVVAHGPDAGLFILLPEPVLFWLAMKAIDKDEKIATAYKRL